MKEHTLIFDVESTSLHGEGFAVGAIVFDGDFKAIDIFELLSIEGAEKASDWVKENVLPSLMLMPVCETTAELRTRFYEWYMTHKDTCEVYSDVNFPVETNFLSAIVADDPAGREWNMPYPLNDVAAYVPVDVKRSDYASEGAKEHNPIDDARSSFNALLNYKG